MTHQGHGGKSFLRNLKHEYGKDLSIEMCIIFLGQRNSKSISLLFISET